MYWRRAGGIVVLDGLSFFGKKLAFFGHFWKKVGVWWSFVGKR